jgi:hypothetical protein
VTAQTRPPLLEELGQVVVAAREILAGAWWPALASEFVGAILGAIAGWLCLAGVAIVGALLKDDRYPGVREDVIDAAVAGIPFALFVAMTLLGPLRAFTLARDHTGVGYRDATRGWFERAVSLWAILAVPFWAVATAFLTWGRGHSIDGDELVRAVVIGGSLLAVGASSVVGFVALGELGQTRPRLGRSVAAAFALARSHAPLAALGVGTGALPFVGGVGPLFFRGRGGFLETAAETLFPWLQLAALGASVYLTALLAAASHQVASGEGPD